MHYKMKKLIHIDLFLIQRFKTFYLSDDNSDLRSVFTNKSLSMRSSKLPPMLTCFDKLFFIRLRVINPSTRELSTALHVSYQR
jgi:hypothetical protein